jgi:hypothetical protein
MLLKQFNGMAGFQIFRSVDYIALPAAKPLAQAH